MVAPISDRDANANSADAIAKQTDQQHLSDRQNGHPEGQSNMTRSGDGRAFIVTPPPSALDGRAEISRQQGKASENTGRFSGGVYVYMVAIIAALGGLLFGYDTGVVSGAQHYFSADFHLNSTTQEIAVSSVLIGAIIGAALGGKLADRFGRKITLIIMAIIFAAGAILTAIATNLELFVAFRILVGIGIGASSVVAPMYTTELVPARVRGQMVFLFQLAVTVGILVAYLIDLWFASAGWGWRPMFAVAIFPAAALGIGMFLLRDTPRWLASKSRWDEASQAMRRVSNSDDESQQEIGRIRTGLEQERHSSPKELFRAGLRGALVIGLGLAILQQLVGINTIIYYAPIVTGYSGFGQKGNSLTGALLVGIVNVLATIAAVSLVDRVGRRKLLLTGTAGIFVTLAAIGVLFALGPQRFGPVILIAILLYIVSFAIGLGPVFWLMSSEVFPTRLRGTGESISTVGNWGANLIVSITFLTLLTALGQSLTFWIYACFALVTLVFVWFLLPETKNKDLEQIEDFWLNGRSWNAVEQRDDTNADDRDRRRTRDDDRHPRNATPLPSGA